MTKINLDVEIKRRQSVVLLSTLLRCYRHGFFAADRVAFSEHPVKFVEPERADGFFSMGRIDGRLPNDTEIDQSCTRCF